MKYGLRKFLVVDTLEYNNVYGIFVSEDIFSRSLLRRCQVGQDDQDHQAKTSAKGEHKKRKGKRKASFAIFFHMVKEG